MLIKNYTIFEIFSSHFFNFLLDLFLFYAYVTRWSQLLWLFEWNSERFLRKKVWNSTQTQDIVIIIVFITNYDDDSTLEISSKVFLIKKREEKFLLQSGKRLAREFLHNQYPWLSFENFSSMSSCRAAVA